MISQVLGDMPRKRYEFTRRQEPGEPLEIPPGQTVMDALKRVLHLPSVCSKRFLTTKVSCTSMLLKEYFVGIGISIRIKISVLERSLLPSNSHIAFVSRPIYTRGKLCLCSSGEVCTSHSGFKCRVSLLSSIAYQKSEVSL